VDFEELRPGLWRWTAPHPEWRPDSEWEREVGSACCETPEAVCLIDPLVPAEDESAFWSVLDREIERARKPVAVLLTVPWHRRSSDAVGARYEAERRGWEFSLRSREPPAGIEPIEIAPTGERAFWLPAHRTLVVGDVLTGVGGGKLRVCPVSWITREATYPKEFLASLARLLELPAEMVLVSHGEAVLARARPVLEEAVRAARVR
jgi:hypothetical protein